MGEEVDLFFSSSSFLVALELSLSLSVRGVGRVEYISVSKEGKRSEKDYWCGGIMEIR